MPRFQYLTLKVEPGGRFNPEIAADELNGHLNRLGAEGWELVSAVGVDHNRGEVILFLKRICDG